MGYKYWIFIPVIQLAILYPEARVIWECKSFKPWDPLGSCGLNHPKPAWGRKNIDVVSDPKIGEDFVLRVFYPKYSWIRNETNHGGIGFKARPWTQYKKATHLKLEYDVLFSDNFDFTWGGKLPGFYGGRGACTGGKFGKNCFSTRFMWRRRGVAELYAYMTPESNPETAELCKVHNVYCNFDYGHSIARNIPGFTFIPGRWHHIAQTIHLNEPCKKDGYVSIEFDGERIFDLTALQLRGNSRITIDHLHFSTFFGGGKPKYASTRDVYTYFKNFKVSDDTIPKYEC